MKGSRDLHGLSASDLFLSDLEAIVHFGPRIFAQQIIRAVKMADAMGKDSYRGPPLRTFGIWLGALRRRKHIDLEVLAKRTQIHPDVLLGIEIGIVPLKQVVDYLPDIEAALEVLPGELTQLFICLVLTS
jgi:hypothetical protein